MSLNQIPHKKLLAALISAPFFLAGCGGGGGGTTTTLTGTAASGMPLVGATVSAYDKNGQCATATTGPNGQFSVDVSTCSGDIAFVAQPLKTSLVSAVYTSMVPATAVTNGQNVNITPWTTAILNGVLGSGLTGSQIAQALNTNTDQSIATVAAYLMNKVLTSAGLSSFNPMSTSFVANGSGFDGVLDNSTINGADIVVGTGSGGQTITIANDGTVSSNTSSIQPSGSQKNASYLDINYMQPIDGSTTSVVATDSSTSNAHGNGGNQAFPATPIGTTGLSTPTFYTTTPDDLALNYQWGPSAVYFVNSYSSNPSNPYMGAVEMVCQQVSGNGISGTAAPTTGNGPQSGTYSNLKSTDVLVTNSATPLTDASALAGLTFNSYYEDCTQGDTLPATVNTANTTYNQLQFDASGNLTVTVTNGATTAPQTFTLTAAQVTAMLNGHPQTAAAANGANSYTTFNAYSFTSAYGTKKVVIVEHGGAGTSASSPSRGYVGLWSTGG